MSRGLNKVMIIGQLGRDPEMRYTPSGRPVTTFTIETSRSWVTVDNQEQTETEKFNVIAWGNLAENCKHDLSKNRKAFIEGRLQTRKWQDHSGGKHSSVEIVAQEVICLDKENFSENIDNEIYFRSEE
ncbi:MAG: single-stranded DNA-binding protein [Anaerolineaceae bacterium]|nr:single-stranded DNA-binding protein [Anaerolineaceae bacterium]